MSPIASLIGCFFAVAFFTTSHSSEHESTGPTMTVMSIERDYHRDNDNRHEYREGRKRHDNDRYEHRRYVYDD